MTALTQDSTVGQFVVERPSRSRLFEKLGIDYCCGGKKSLSEACAHRKLDPQAVLQTIQAEEVTPAPLAFDPAAISLTELADHIEQTHHAWLREELPRLRRLVDKVAAVHGETYPWLVELRQTYHALEAEMNDHMGKEEQVLFPLIRWFDSNAPAPVNPMPLEGPIDCMEHEHESAGNAMATMESLSNGFTPPDGACNTFRAMLDGLAGLQADLHTHVHKENNILFPRAIALSHRKSSARGVA